MKKILFLLILLTACTDNSTAYRVLKNDGYTNIKFTGYSWFACSQDDFYHTGFIAVRNQNKVSGTVCSGLIFKNATIRFE